MVRYNLSLLTNDEVLDVNQDPQGRPAGRRSKDGQLEVWARPLWDGTTLFGVSHLYDLATQLGLDPLINGALDPACGSCREFLHGSAFLANLHSGNGVFQPGVEYTNILTRYDEAVTPYTSGLGSGPNVHNIVLQDSCPLDFSEHGGLAADRNAAGHVLNALDPADATPVPCHPASALGS